MHVTPSFTPLKLALAANVAFSSLSGTVLAIYPDTVAAMMGADAHYRALGIGLLGFAVLGSVLIRWRLSHTFWALMTSFADLSWVLGSVLLLALAGGWMSATGHLAIVLVALTVLAIALAQLRGIGRAYELPQVEGGYYLDVIVPTSVAPDAIWPVIRDLGGIHQYSDDLVSSHIRDAVPAGEGAVRQCSNRAQARWAEQCVCIDDALREVDLRFLHEELGFPFPVDRLQGGWRVAESGHGSIVTIWWIAHMPAWKAPLLLPLMHRSLDASMGKMVGSMALGASEHREVFDGQPLPSPR